MNNVANGSESQLARGSVLYEVSERIATITINEPENRNALSSAVRDGLRKSFRRFNEDTDASVAILTGAGGKAFCAGGDLKDMSNSQMSEVPKDYLPIPGRNMKVDKPIIAAVNGFAVGGGVLYTILADLAVASETAKFIMPETKISRGAPWSVPLLQQIPRKVWFELAVTGDPMSARRAYEVGLLNAVVPPDELMSTARDLAMKIVRAAPLAVKATMDMVRTSGGMTTEDAWDAADELFLRVYRSNDALEGPKSWLEKRDPVWSGT